MDFIAGRGEAAGNQIGVITYAADLRRILTRNEMPDRQHHLRSLCCQDEKLAAYA